VTADGGGLGAIARRVIDPNRFVTVGTADEEHPLDLAGLVRPGGIQGF